MPIKYLIASTFTDYHREEKGKSRGILCPRCTWYNKPSCSHYGIFPSKKRLEMEQWLMNHPHLKYQFLPLVDICSNLGLMREYLINVDTKSREYVHSRTLAQLKNEVALSYSKHYVSPDDIRHFQESSVTTDGVTSTDAIGWGLRARGVFNDDDLHTAYTIGVDDGRVPHLPEPVNMFAKRKHTLLFLCEYGNEITYSR